MIERPLLLEKNGLVEHKFWSKWPECKKNCFNEDEELFINGLKIAEHRINTEHRPPLEVEACRHYILQRKKDKLN